MKDKLFYVEYSIQIMDGITEYQGHIYAENRNSVCQIIHQIAKDLKAKDHFIDIVEEVLK